MRRWIQQIARCWPASRTRRRQQCYLPRLVLLERRIVPTFLAPQNFATAAQPVAVTVLDVNRDGKSDLVTADMNNGTVSVLLGNGDGTFLAAQNFATGAKPDSIAAADFNGDGKPDLAVANYGSDTVSVLLGNGDGTFKAAQSFTTGSKPMFVATGDFNRDGKLDLVTANYGSNTVSVLLGNGDGTFKAGQTVTVGTKPDSVAASDFNDDGKLDFAVANEGDGAVSVLLGNGDGSFQAPKTFAVGSAPASVAAVDLNGDAQIDLVVANRGSNSVSVLLSNGNGTFQAAKNLTTESNPSSVAAADVNGDGQIDLVAANYGSSSVSVLLGTGKGVFLPARSFPTGAGPADVVIADVSGDGRPDLITASATGNAVSVLRSDSAAPGLGSFQSAQQFTTGTLAYAVVTADLRHDGKLDIITANRTSNTVSVLLGNGDGTFGTNQDYPTGSNPRGLAVADVNGDGKLDLIYTSYDNNTVSVRLGNGDGTFQSSDKTFSVGSRPIGVTAADINGDGKLDLAVADYFQGTASILLGNGDGTFQADNPVPMDALMRSASVADVNLDGKPDLVAAAQGVNQVSVALGNGDGTFKTAQNFATGLSPWMSVVADVNRDGKPDVILPNFSGNSVGVLLGNGDGTFQAVQNFAATSGPSAVAVADLRGDGLLDLVAANEGGKTLSVLLGNGNDTFQNAKDYISGSYPDAVAVADVNGDGKPDLVAANYTGKNASVLLGIRNATTHLQVTGPGTSAAGTSVTITVTALTADNQSDWLFTHKVHFTSSDVSAQLPADTAFTLNDYGSRSFDVTLNSGGSQTITVTDLTDGSVLGQFTITISGKPPTQLAFVQQPTDGVAGSALSPAVTVAVEDSTGSIVTGNNSLVTLTIQSGPGPFDSTSTVQVAAVNGVATFSNLLFDAAGTYSLAASDGALTTSTSDTFVIDVGAASRLVFVQQPVGGTAGAALNPAVTVAVEDSFGNQIAGDNSVIFMAVQSGPGTFDGASTLQVTAVNGVATFSNLILDSAGSYTLSATAASLNAGVSSSFDVSAASAARLAFGQQPTDGTAGEVISPEVTVSVVDAFGNLVDSDTSTIALTLGGGSAGATLKGTLQVAAIKGVANFKDLTIDLVGTAYTLNATDGALQGAVSAPFNMAGPATHIVFLQQPGATVAGAFLDANLSPAGVRVALEDDLGNIVTTSKSTVTLTLAGGPPGTQLHGTLSLQVDKGVATFTDLSITTAASGFTLTAAAGTLPAMTSTEFTVGAAAASQLVLLQQPANSTAGQTINPSLTVAVEDGFGNVVATDTSAVKVMIHSGPGAFDSISITQVAAVNGIATFKNLILDTAGAYSLTPVDGSLTSPISLTFQIEAAAPSKLVFGQQPTNSTAGSPMSPGLTVTVTDAFGNLVSSVASTLTVAVKSGPGGFDGSSTLQATPINGIASFANLILDAAGSYTLSVTAGSLTAGTSAAFVVRSASPSQVVFGQQPKDSAAGTAISPAINVFVEDRFGNLVTDSSAAVTIGLHSGPSTLDGASITQATAASGVAVFSKLILDSAGTYTLSAASVSLTGAISSGFVVHAAASAQLVFLQQPANTRAGLAGNPAAIVAVEDKFGNLVTGDSSLVSIALHSGPGVLDGASTAQVTATGGMAAFNNLILDTAGLYTLTASDGLLTPAISATFIVRTADASRLTIHLPTGQATAGTAVSPAVTVTVEDSFGNVVVSDNSLVTMSLQSGPGSFANGSVTQATAINGVASFNKLILDSAGAYTLAATDGSLAASSSLIVHAATVSRLAFVQQPSDTTAGVAIGPAVTVAFEDAFGNVVDSSQAPVTLVVETGTGNFDDASTLQVVPISGVAAFTNLILDQSGTYTISATAAGLSAGDSGSFLVSPATPSQLVFVQQPADSLAGTALNPGIAVAVEDRFGNLVTGDSSTLTLKIASGPGVFESGDSTQATAINGVAFFADLKLDKAGTYTLTASNSALPAATSTEFAVDPAAASLLAFLALPTNAVAGIKIHPAVTVAIEDAFGNVVDGDASTVIIAIQSGPGAFTSASTLQANVVHGIASFNNLALDTEGAYTLTATDGSLKVALASIDVASSSTVGPAAGFVASLYGVVLNRHPDSGGLTFWTQQLDRGESRIQVAQGFWESAEHRGLEVDQDYTTFLHRKAEAGGRAFWIAAFASGLDERGVAVGFVTSTEYQAANPTMSLFLTAVYDDGLGRNPDASGLLFWTTKAALSKGMSTAALGILSSAEANARLLDQYYANLLVRKPDAPGERFWSNLLLSGQLGTSTLAEAFLASDEFFGHATNG